MTTLSNDPAGTRVGLALGAMALVVVALAAACGGGDHQVATPPVPTTTGPLAPSTTGAPPSTTPAPTTTPAPAPPANRVEVYGDCATPRVEPTAIVLACADHGIFVQDIRWTHWAATAAGAGTLVYNDCTPNCAEGHFHSVPGTQVTLTTPVTGAGGHVVYSEIQLDPLPPGWQTGPYHGGPVPLPIRPD